MTGQLKTHKRARIDKPVKALTKQMSQLIITGKRRKLRSRKPVTLTESMSQFGLGSHVE